MYLNIELGDPSLFYDSAIFNSMLFGFLGGTILVAIIMFVLLKPICKITKIPMKYFFPALLASTYLGKRSIHRRMGRLCHIFILLHSWLYNPCVKNF